MSTSVHAPRAPRHVTTQRAACAGGPIGKRELGRRVALGLLMAALLAAPLRQAHAEVSEASPRPDEQFDLMNVLARHGLHDIEDESWNAYGQLTFISSWKLRLPAAYTNAGGSTNSLLERPELSFTGTVTFFLGVRLWPGAEAYFVPEVIAERPLSQLRGLGSAIQNFELQKTGSETPQIYRSRVFVKQTFGLGGEQVKKSSDPMQLGSVVEARRIVLLVGNFSVLDFVDKNSFAGDLRQQFFNMAFLTHAAYDFAADARGYAWGGIAELYYDAWALRVGRLTPPENPNQLPIDFRIGKHYGDQIELEHVHELWGQAGAVRLLGYRNQERMGRFDDALAAYQADPSHNATTCSGFNYGSANASAPDLCWARRENVKLGIGLNLEQHVSEDLGVFLRGMLSDGQSEVYSYTSTDRSLSFGALGHGASWGRKLDIAGVGLGLGWISAAHARYLGAGGIDGFIGDGRIHAGAESVLEIFYSLNVADAAWLSLDYQHITNPGFNTDRGPVDLFGARIHAEF